MKSQPIHQVTAIVRAVEPDDYAAVKEIYAQPNAYSGTLQMPLPSEFQWKKRLETPPPGIISLVACVDDVPVGHIGLIPAANPRRRHSAHLGMGVHDRYAGQGIGHLLMDSVLDIADNWMNLSRLELTVYTDNDRAIRLYKRTGFEQEGILRKYAFRDGEYVDALTMARLR
jgi:putative acetyltransferase